jgi:hypothetical protein
LNNDVPSFSATPANQAQSNHPNALSAGTPQDGFCSDQGRRCLSFI